MIVAALLIGQEKLQESFVVLLVEVYNGEETKYDPLKQVFSLNSLVCSKKYFQLKDW